jgi:competence protein ComEA
VFFFTRGERVLITLLLAALVAGGGTLLYLKGKRAGASREPFFSESPLAARKGAVVTVHVAGEVHKPGLVTLPPSARVRDAVARAGGLTEKADANAVNLAAEVLDGQKIEVPAKRAPGEGAQAPPPPRAVAAARPQGPAKLKPGQTISINAASAEQLQRLPGIGPAYAQRIVAYRQDLKRTTGSGFTAAEQLMNVPGIGPKRFAEIRPYVRL